MIKYESVYSGDETGKIFIHDFLMLEDIAP